MKTMLVALSLLIFNASFANTKLHCAPDVGLENKLEAIQLTLKSDPSLPNELVVDFYQETIQGTVKHVTAGVLKGAINNEYTDLSGLVKNMDASVHINVELFGEKLNFYRHSFLDPFYDRREWTCHSI